MIQISKGKRLNFIHFKWKPKYFKHPTSFFVKNLTDSAIELAVPLGKSEDYGAVLLKH
jgi:hypothetical protein